MKIIYVIGPSAVGKTTLCKQLSEALRTVVHVSFDEQLKHLLELPFPMPQQRSGEEGREFWRFCQGVIERFSRPHDSDIILLVDVDAGAEYIPECQSYLIDHADSVLCVMAAPEILYQREMERAAKTGNPSESKETFLEREFSPDLQRIYQSAAVTVDASNNDFATTMASFKTAVETLTQRKNLT